MDLITQSPEFKAWFADIFGERSKYEWTCVLLQVLHKWDRVESELELQIYLEIIRKELARTEDFLLVKPHPREDSKRLEALKQMLTQSERRRTIFLKLDKFGALPFEMMMQCLPVKTLAGLFSTSMMLGATFEGLHVRAYTFEGLPKRVRKAIRNYTLQGSFVPCKLQSVHLQKSAIGLSNH